MVADYRRGCDRRSGDDYRRGRSIIPPEAGNYIAKVFLTATGTKKLRSTADLTGGGFTLTLYDVVTKESSRGHGVIWRYDERSKASIVRTTTSLDAEAVLVWILADCRVAPQRRRDGERKKEQDGDKENPCSG